MRSSSRFSNKEPDQRARFVAAETLNNFDPTFKFAEPVLDKFLSGTLEKQKATDLVYGTIRNRIIIDKVIAVLSDIPVERIPKGILNVIRIVSYELIYCPPAAVYAIVNEAVENAKVLSGNKPSSFVNAVLRRITAHIQQRQLPLLQANPRRTLPQDMNFGCQFDIDLLPDPAERPVDYLSSAFSLPRWLVADWLEDFGLEKARQICFASNRKPSIYLRANILRTTPENLSEKLKETGIEFQIVESTMIKVKSPKNVTAMPGFFEGLFSVQDLTSAIPAKLLKPRPGWKILDMCAAPGTKTTQLAELSEDNAAIIATDIDSSRLELVKDNIKRLGLESIEVVEYSDLQKIIEEGKKFDDVLLDVPCSNSGVLAKRPEARFRITKKAIDKLLKTQMQLLEMAEPLVKTGGKICYSTCSIQKQENGLLIRNFLTQNRFFCLEDEKLTLPYAGENDYDGGYTAILTRVK
jgi:16S rRNA (cytosine967-C5)-methyltransferase